MTTEVDWKAIAMTLAGRVQFAINNLKADGSGMVGTFDPNATDVDMQHWMQYFADALDTIPGVKIDREVMMLNNLPRSKGQKAFKELLAARKAAGDAA